MNTKEKIQEYRSEILLLGALAGCGIIYLGIRSFLLALPAEPLVVMNGILAISFGTKFFIKKELCGIVTKEQSRYYILHWIHNMLTVLVLWISIGYGEYLNYTNASHMGIILGIEAALFIEIVYFFTHNTKSNRNWKTVAAYAIATVIITVLVANFSMMVQMMGAEKQQTSQVVVKDEMVRSGSKSSTKTYLIQVEYETGEKEEFKIPKSKYGEYEIGTKLTITTYKGMTGATWNKLE